MSVERQPIPPLALAVALALLTVAVFWPATGYDFINFDDYGYVKENPAVKSGLSLANLRWAFTTAHEQWYLPLLWVSFMIDTEIFGADPFGYHLTNILLHALNVGLLFWILFRMTGSVWRSAFVAALFALHPTRVEAVAWVTARKDTLSGLFFLLSLLAYMRHIDKPSRASIAWVSVWMVLGLLSKSILIVLPALLLLLDYWPLRRASVLWGSGFWKEWRPLLAEKIPLIALAVLFVVITLSTHETGRGDHTPMTAIDRLGMIPPNYWSYIGKILWPAPLSIFYPHRDAVNWVGAVVSLAGLIAVTLLLLRIRKERPWLIVGWVWFLVALFPVIRGMRMGLAAYTDRFTYLPLIGLGMVLTWGAGEWLANRRQAAILLAGVVLAACLIQTRAYLPVWTNTLTVFRHALALYPNASLLNTNYGRALCEVGRYEEGFPFLYRAAALQPDNYEILDLLGAMLYRRQRYEEALIHHEQSLTLKPSSASAHNNRGNALEALGRRAEAIASYRAALGLDPQFADAHYNLANLLYYEQRLPEALFHYQEAVRHKDEFALAWFNLGVTLTRLQRYPEAAQCVIRSLQLDPDMPAARQTLQKIQADMIRP